MRITTVFENQSFIIVDKPAAVLTVPGRMGDADPRPVLAKELAKMHPFVLPVHRLDEEVSGLIVFAKNADAHRIANQWFENKKIQKTYEAWTEEGDVSDLAYNTPVEWRSFLLRGKKRAYESPHGKESITRARWMGSFDFRSRLSQKWFLDPLTGRSHQLRVELTKRHYPILGDVLYGSKTEFLPNTIALRAIKLDFTQCDEASRLGLPPLVEVSGLESLLK